MLAGMSFLTGLAGGMVCAQEPPAPAQQPPTASAPLQQEDSKNVATPCVQPAPMVRLEDYDGPLKKVVGTFARPLERKAVPLSRYRPGVKLCTLDLKDKFALFVQDSFDPVTFLGTGFNAGIDQAQNGPAMGRGSGVRRRFGAEFAGQALRGSLLTLRILRYFRRTRATTVWFRLTGGVCSTPWSSWWSLNA
jgi:hypothetical protein